MRTNYLLIVFIAAAALFFYFASNFSQTGNPFMSGNATSTSGGARPTGNQTSGKSSTPSGFQGPTGQPYIIGPKAPPPNY